MTTEEYVGGLVEIARDDKSVPVLDAQGKFVGWETNDKLFEVEVDILRNQRNPELYAEICRLALQELTQTKGVGPAVLTIVGLGQLNGRRRLTPITTELEGEVFGMISRIQAENAELPEDLRRERCVQFLKYQFSTFLDACGSFNKAAKIQREAARLAEEIGDRPLAAVSSFMAFTHDAKYAFCTGEGIDQAIDALINFIPALQNAVRGTQYELGWGVGNAYNHALQCLAWSDQVHDDEWERLITEFLDLDKVPLLGQEFEDQVKLWNAVDVDATEELISLVNSKSPEASATALLMLMRFALGSGNATEAREYYNLIPGTSTVRHIRAVADREFYA